MIHNRLALVVWRLQQLVEFAAVAVDHGEVEGAEVLVEGHVGEVRVNVEEESILDVGGRLGVGDPVEFAGNYFHLTSELLVVALQRRARVVRELRLARV